MPGASRRSGGTSRCAQTRPRDGDQPVSRPVIGAEGQRLMVKREAFKKEDVIVTIVVNQGDVGLTRWSAFLGAAVFDDLVEYRHFLHTRKLLCEGGRLNEVFARLRRIKGRVAMSRMRVSRY